MDSEHYAKLRECLKDIDELATDCDLDTYLTPWELHSAFDSVYGYEIVKEAISRVSKKYHVYY